MRHIPTPSPATETERAPPLLERILAAATGPGVGRACVQQALAAPSVEEVAEMLAALRQDPRWLETTGRRAYLHANGFVKIPLAERDGVRVRLHSWPGDAQGEENVHNHRWDMASRVLVGSLRQEIYEALAPATEVEGPVVARGYRYQKARPGLAATTLDLGRWSLRVAGASTLRAGQVYALRHEVFHRLAKRHARPVVTLMVQSAPVRDHNHMFCLTEKAPDVCPVPLGSARLSARLREVAAALTGARAEEVEA